MNRNQIIDYLKVTKLPEYQGPHGYEKKIVLSVKKLLTSSNRQN
jgi:hypothetical protein